MTGIERLRDIADDRYSGGMVHISVQKLREICEQIEREFGVETVKAEGIAANNRRIELCGALGIDTDTGWSDAMAEMVKRLMPDGMCWPVFEDGEPVRIGDFVSDVEVRSVVFRDGGILLSDCTSVPGWGTWRSYKEPIKRPTPKVLDADGVEIRVGDTVYDVDTGEKMWVCALPEQGAYQCVKLRLANGMSTALDPYRLTHRAPVLAADGRPLREGELGAS